MKLCGFSIEGTTDELHSFYKHIATDLVLVIDSIAFLIVIHEISSFRKPLQNQRALQYGAPSKVYFKPGKN